MAWKGSMFHESLCKFLLIYINHSSKRRGCVCVGGEVHSFYWIPKGFMKSIPHIQKKKKKMNKNTWELHPKKLLWKPKDYAFGLC